MRIALSSYIRSMKERDELDALLPDLLLSMSIVPITKPGIGPRQFGVDLAAVGPDADGEKKLWLFVIKRGDIGRRDWDNESPQSVRPSLNELFDVYLQTHVQPHHASLPIKVVLTTSGDLKEAVYPNWANFQKTKAGRAEFDFWGADRLSEMVDSHLLNENLFGDSDRNDLRRCLAFIGERSYGLDDFFKLLLRTLGLDPSGQLEEGEDINGLKPKTLNIISLLMRIITRWAASDGNTINGLLAAERALLWSFHRIQKCGEKEQAAYSTPFGMLIDAYEGAAAEYLEKISPYFAVQDGLSGYTDQSALHSLNLFENMGLLAAYGLHLCYTGTETKRQFHAAQLESTIRSLKNLIENNPACASPRLDNHSIDMTLACILFSVVGEERFAEEWLEGATVRLDYTFRVKRNFPVGTDSVDDLIELSSGGADHEELPESIQSSWCLATFAAWHCILRRADVYEFIARQQSKNYYEDVTAQLWHPSKDLYETLYFRYAAHDCGFSDAPIIFNKDVDDYVKKMDMILARDDFAVDSVSPALSLGQFGLDFIANRHFRTPPAPSFWFKFLHATLFDDATRRGNHEG